MAPCGTKHSRKRNGRLILFVVGVLVCGFTRDSVLTWRFHFDGILSHFQAADHYMPQNQSWITPLSFGISGQVNATTRHVTTHATHLPARPSGPLGTGVLINSTVPTGGGLSPCPAKNTSQSQNQSSLPLLHFVHIRKTGGTAVVASFKQGGLDPYKTVALNLTALRAKRIPGNRRHIPPRYWKGGLLESMVNVHWFTIVRNPYERAISEYYQHFKFGIHRPPSGISVNDANFLNYFIQTHFRNGTQDLFFPQYEYIFNTQGNQMVHHILRFESIQKEFPPLMECYGLNVSLPSVPVNKRQAAAGLGVANLTAESIAVINEVERLSFEVLGYEMLSINSTFSPPTE